MHHKVTTVKAFFRWAVEMEYIESDPSTKLVVPKRPRTFPKTLTESQIDFLLHRWEPYYIKRDAYLIDRDKALVKVFIMTGLRRAEMCALDVGDVNLEGRASPASAFGGGEGAGRIDFALEPRVERGPRRRGGGGGVGRAGPARVRGELRSEVKVLGCERCQRWPPGLGVNRLIRASSHRLQSLATLLAVVP